MKNFSSLILILLLFACDDEKSKKWTEVKITATNYITGEPISDVYCGVLTVDDGFLFNDKTVTLDENWMENGIYEFGFKAKKNKTYWAEASIDILKYYPISFSNYMNIDNNEINVYEFSLVEPGYLKLHFKNLNCEDENDDLYFRYFAKDEPSDLDYIYIKNWSNSTLNGCVDLISDSYQKLPAVTYTIEWYVERTSGTTYGSDTFSVADSTTYLLEY